MNIELLSDIGYSFDNTLRSESRCGGIKGVPLLKEPKCLKTELNNYTLYRYCTSTAV
jgi:hypothetical protein